MPEAHGLGSGPQGVLDVHGDAYGKFSRGPSYGFGPSDTNKPRRSHSQPGPGAYGFDVEKVRPRNPSWGFGSTKRSAWAEGSAASPGPSHYLPTRPGKDLGSSGPAYSLGVRRGGGMGGGGGGGAGGAGGGAGSRYGTPGPGEYRPNDTQPNTQPYWGSGDAGRPASCPISPGPGQYGYGDHASMGVGGCGPKWSLGGRGNVMREELPRKLGGPFTHIGY